MSKPEDEIAAEILSTCQAALNAIGHLPDRLALIPILRRLNAGEPLPRAEKYCFKVFHEGQTEKVCWRLKNHSGACRPYLDSPLQRDPGEPAKPRCPKSCLLCGHERDKAVIHEPSGQYVCTTCRQKVKEWDEWWNSGFPAERQEGWANELAHEIAREIFYHSMQFYQTEELAMAPNIADGWPDIIKAPHTKRGRLQKELTVNTTEKIATILRKYALPAPPSASERVGRVCPSCHVGIDTNGDGDCAICGSKRR